MHGIVDDGDTRLWGGLHFHKNWLSSHCDNPPPLWLAKLALFTPGGHGGLAKHLSDKLKCLFEHFSWEKETNPDKRCGFNSNIHQPVHQSNQNLFWHVLEQCHSIICLYHRNILDVLRKIQLHGLDGQTILDHFVDPIHHILHESDLAQNS